MTTETVLVSDERFMQRLFIDYWYVLLLLLLLL